MNLDTILGLTAAAVSAAVLAVHYWRHWPEDVRAAWETWLRGAW